MGKCSLLFREMERPVLLQPSQAVWGAMGRHPYWVFPSPAWISMYRPALSVRNSCHLSDPSWFPQEKSFRLRSLLLDI